MSTLKHSHTLFQHHKDRMEFALLFSLLKDKLSKVPDIAIQHIAEFSVGAIAKCQAIENQKLCQKEILVLHQDKEKYKLAKPAHSLSELLGFKYCTVLNKYFCSKHMNQMIPDPLCCRQGLFDSTLKNGYYSSCVDCQGSYICHDECSEKCHNCMELIKGCNKCRYSRQIDAPCESCEYIFCKTCSTIRNVGNMEWILCYDCLDETVISCKSCNNEEIIGYKQNDWIGGSWTLCVEPKCMRWICLKCSNDPVCKKHKY